MTLVRHSPDGAHHTSAHEASQPEQPWTDLAALARAAPWWEQEGAVEEPDERVEVAMVDIPSEPANDKAVA